MRVLMWTQHYAPHIGGVEVLVRALNRDLVSRGHEVAVITSAHQSGLPAEENLDGVTIRRFRFLDALLERDIEAIARETAAVAAFKAAFRPDVVHIHFSDPSVLFHLRTQRHGDAPCALTVHVALPQRNAGSRSLLARTIAGADRVVAISEACRRDVERLAPNLGKRLMTIRNALPEMRNGTTDPPHDPPVVLGLGRLARDKGFDILISALPALRRTRPDIRVVVAGDGPARQELEELARRLGVADCITWQGLVAPDAIPETLRAATVVVVPSRWREMFGLVALEAAQAGRPVVAARRGGLPEVVENGRTGLLVEPEDPADLAAAVGRIIIDPCRAREMGRAGRRMANDRFRFDSFATAHYQLYDTLRKVAE